MPGLDLQLLLSAEIGRSIVAYWLVESDCGNGLQMAPDPADLEDDFWHPWLAIFKLTVLRAPCELSAQIRHTCRSGLLL